MKTTAKSSPIRRKASAGPRSREAERLERMYRELGFVPRRSAARMAEVGRGFVFTPPSFLPYVPYTVTTLAGV